MKLAIMQPYAFPYIGYFQLISEADLFILYDDVQYIQRGWINRNRIRINNEIYTFCLSVKKGSRSDKINEKKFADDIHKDVESILRSIQLAYKKAPYYNIVFPLLEEIFSSIPELVVDLISKSLEIICNYLDIETPIIKSSSIVDNGIDLKGEERIIYLNSLYHSDTYINAIGGRELYNPENFQKKGIALKFLEKKDISYSQGSDVFMPDLSIIDVLMFNSKEEVKHMLQEYNLYS